MIVQQNCRAWITLDHAALSFNLSQVKKRLPNVQIMSAIKADAYGHGLEWAAKCLYESDQFAVCNLDDLNNLRSAGIDKPVTLLSAILDKQGLRYCQRHNATPAIYDWSQLKLFDELQADDQIDIWLKVDTGMGRLGFLPEQVPSILNRKHSLLNSGGIVHFPKQANEIVRPGIMLYGASPAITEQGEPKINMPDLELRSVMNFYSRIVSIKQYSAGQAIGYGSRYTCSEATTVAYVSVGYGDGYPRHAKTGTPVLIGGHRAELLGRVSMDLIAVNLNNNRAEVGDVVTLWGQGLPVEEVAYYADTISYELFCGITNRVERFEI